MTDALLARVLALSSDEEQAAFFNEVGRVMAEWKEPGAREMQCFRIGDKLNFHGRDLVRRMFENLCGDP